jgi:hypothetical protein
VEEKYSHGQLKDWWTVEGSVKHVDVKKYVQMFRILCHGKGKIQFL